MKTGKQTVAIFWQQIRRYPALLTGSLVSVPLALLARRFLPALIIANILDRLSRHDFKSHDIWGSFGPQLILLVTLVTLSSVVLWRLVDYFVWKLEGYVERDLANRVFDQLMKLSANFHANNFGGSLVSQTSKLISAYVRMADTTVFGTLTIIWSFIFTAIIMWQRATLFVILLTIFSAIYLATAAFITRAVRRRASEAAAASNHQTAYLADSVANVMAVKSFATGSREIENFARIGEATRQAEMRVMRTTLNRENIFATIDSAIETCTLVIAIAAVVLYQANIAVVFLILTYTTNLLVQLWEFSTQSLRNYNRAFGDAQGMTETLMLKPSVQDPLQPEKSRISKGAISFKNMTFTHSETQKDDALFRNLNLEIKPSEKIGLVGQSGSGKTTLTKLLLRFSDINSGEILIDGQNIAHIRQDDLRRGIAYVPQEPLLFHRTIRENIAYGKPNATEAEIRAAAQKAYAQDFIDKLPKGYETLVGERGVKLSGGQRQRIAIARAILKDAPILLLDEATSALDSESEKLIQAALWQLMEGRTAIVIAHRLSTIQKMDRILVMDNGQIVEEGTHTNLLQQKGIYAKLWAHQSGGFIED